LKDPRSAQLESFTKDGNKVKITYRATNSYGAYLTQGATCALGGDGEVEPYLTFLTRENEKLDRDLAMLRRDGVCIRKVVLQMKSDFMLSKAEATKNVRKEAGCESFRSAGSEDAEGNND